MNKPHVSEKLSPMLEKLKSTANVECVFGTPFEAHGKLYVPVATVRYGYGQGLDDNGEPGMGAGYKSKPAGVLEITPEGAKFIRFEPSIRSLVATAAGIWFGLRFLSSLRKH